MSVRKYFVVVSGALALLFAFLYLWQFLIDPRFSESTPPKEILSGLSRAIFGEHCQRKFWIASRSDAIALARVAFRGQSIKGFMAGSEQDFLSFIIDSDLFRHGGDENRTPNTNGWSASYSQQDIGRWYVDYLFEDDARSAYLTAEITACGRMISVLNIASMKRPRAGG